MMTRTHRNRPARAKRRLSVTPLPGQLDRLDAYRASRGNPSYESVIRAAVDHALADPAFVGRLQEAQPMEAAG